MTLAALYLAALSTPRLGLKRLWQLKEACGGIEAALSGCGGRGVLEEGGPPLAEIARCAVRAAPAAASAVNAAASAGLSVRCWEDPGYPPALLVPDVYSAPVLFIDGALPRQVLEVPDELASCAIVGTRRAAPFSLEFARDLARAAARVGVTVVSGLALGVDAAAHEGALEAGHSGGGTVAVLGGGHSRLHPSVNSGLARRIVAAGGAVISEWPPGVNPQPHQFLRRNRVIVALSKVLAVIEAGVPSGALNSANHAFELGRHILSVPAWPGGPRNRGSLQLLRDGAQLLLDSTDLLGNFPNASPAPDEPVRQVALPFPGDEPPGGLEALLTTGEETLDSLASATGRSPSELLSSLAQLELQGRVRRTPTGRFRLRR